MLPPRPSTADISTYLSYHALHQLSGREYHEWVQAQADGGAAWAVEMLHSAQVWPKSLLRGMRCETNESAGKSYPHLDLQTRMS